MIDQINYRIEGKKTAPAILFLHGFLGSLKIWKRTIPFFRDQYSVLTMDLPGHGESPFNGEVVSMKDCALAIKKILEKEKLDKVHVVGHSMGGYVALELLHHGSHKIQSITLLNSTAKEDTPQKKKDRLLAVKVFDRSPEVFITAAIENLFYEPSLKLFPKEVSFLQQTALKTSVKGAQGSLRGMKERKDYVELIKRTNTPVHFIAGRYDSTVLYSTILEQTENTNVKLTTLESGHMGFVESFEEYIIALQEFIKKSNENIIPN